MESLESKAGSVARQVIAPETVRVMERLAMDRLTERLDSFWHEIVRRVGGRQGLLTHHKEGYEGRIAVSIDVWSTRPWLFGLFPFWRSGKIEVRVFAEDRTVRFELQREFNFWGGGSHWHTPRQDFGHVRDFVEVITLLERGQIRRIGR